MLKVRLAKALLFLAVIILLFSACDLFFNMYYLEYDIEGNGDLNINPLRSKYREGTVVEITAKSDEGWYFEAFTGDVNSTDQTIELTMDQDKAITAKFVRQIYDLTITILGLGRVEQEVVQVMENEKYPYETIVKLTAIADEGWEFSKWQGDVESDEAIIEVVMDDHQTIEAVFLSKSEITGTIELIHHWPFAANDKLNSLEGAVEKPKTQTNYLANEYVENELIVGFYPFTALETQKDLLNQLNLTVINSIGPLNAYVVEVAASEWHLKQKALLDHQLVRYVEPNYYAYTQQTYPDDELFPWQWHYNQIRLPQAWQITTGDQNVRIAVLDTGINVKHPDIGYAVDVASGYNFVENNQDTTDFHGHGTHVGGTIGADTNNEQGVAGVMWDVTLIPVKVLSNAGGGSYAGIAKGILYAAGLHQEQQLPLRADVINLSLGGSSNSELVKDAVELAKAAGVIMVAAAGNNAGSILYPAAYSAVIAVGAVDFNYPNAPTRASYSSYGPQLDLVAPGGDISIDSNENGLVDGVLSTYVAGDEFVYSLMQGTSMAAPHVSGVIGLMLAQGIAPSEIRSILHATSMEINIAGYNFHYGHGLINAYWAVNNVEGIRIILGSKEDNQIEIAYEKLIDLKAKSFVLENVPQGEYQLMAWIDVLNNNQLDQGDYFVKTDYFFITDGDSLNFDLSLIELK